VQAAQSEDGDESELTSDEEVEHHNSFAPFSQQAQTKNNPPHNNTLPVSNSPIAIPNQLYELRPRKQRKSPQ